MNLVRALVLEQLDPNVEMFDAPVDIIVTARFKSHPQDPDNVCAKVYIDALLGRVIEDDTMEYVASVTTKVVEAEENGVRIEVRQAV